MGGLRSLIIPQSDDATVEDILQTDTALRLIEKGASLYLLDDGRTNMLALKRPAGAFAKALGIAGRGRGETRCAA